MIRDMDLIRKIILEVERVEDADSYSITIEGADADEIAYHCELLNDQGLFNVAGPPYRTNTKYLIIPIQRLSSSGHDFADQIRKDEKWAVAKTMMSLVKQWTLPVLIQKMTEMTAYGWDQRMEQIKEFLGNLSQ